MNTPRPDFDRTALRVPKTPAGHVLAGARDILIKEATPETFVLQPAMWLRNSLARGGGWNNRPAIALAQGAIETIAGVPLDAFAESASLSSAILVLNSAIR